MKRLRRFTIAALCIISAFVLGGCGKKVPMECSGMPGRWGPPVLRTQ